MNGSVVAPKAVRHVKPAVRRIAAYSLAAHPAVAKLNQNENPFELPEAFKRRVLERALERPWARYPDFDPKQLLERLAAFSGWRADGILAGNGSNELIEALLMVTVGPGTRVVIPEPTFSLYALLTRVLGGEVVGVPLGAQLEYDADALRHARAAVAAPVTIACSPNNPTGGVLTPEEVARLCDDGDGLVVIDEAYHEFAGVSVVPLLERHPNLVVLRTLSKAMALAGLRVGYLLAAPALVHEINKARLPYNLGILPQAAALAALDEWESLRAGVERLVAAREALLRELERMPGVEAFPSRANFILFRLAQAEPQAVFEALLARGVLVRDVSAQPGLARCLRVSVGSEAENATFLAALGRALAPPQSARRGA